MTGTDGDNPNDDPTSLLDPVSLLDPPSAWTGTSSDPNDLQFGHVVTLATLEPQTSDAGPRVTDLKRPVDDAESVTNDAESATKDAETAVDDVETAADDAETTVEDAEPAVHDADVVLVGEPYDGAVIGRKGAVDGPGAIRAELASLKTHRFGAGPVGRSTDDPIDSSLSIADLGDVSLANPGDSADEANLPQGTAEVQDRVAAVAGAVHQTNAFPVFLGGDNSLTVGNVRPLLEASHEREERVGVVNFDAHLDVREPTNGPTSGTPYRQLLEAGLDRYVVVGARDFETSTEYADYVEDSGGTVLTVDELGDGIDTARTRIASATADLDHLYVSVDLDVLDAAVAPGVSAPTPGGLTTRELFSFVRSLGSDKRLAGFELVETAPSLDPAAAPDSPERNRTVGAAARTVAHLLAGVAEGRIR